MKSSQVPSAKTFPYKEKAICVYKELKAVKDSGLDSYIFWIPSGHKVEFQRLFTALDKFRNDNLLAKLEQSKIKRKSNFKKEL